MKQINKRVLRKYGLIYAVILLVINLLGYITVITSKVPTEETEATIEWAKFKANNTAFIGASMGIIFLIPFVIAAVYIFRTNEKSLAKRIINLPIMYAFVGSLGWIIPYIFELCCLFYIAFKYGVNMHTVAMTSFLNVVQSAMFIGTFAFLCLDAIHRKRVLPRYFSEGKLWQYKGTRHTSTRVLISIFYLAVGVVPLMYLLSVLVSYSYSYNFKILNIIYDVAVVFIIIGFFMLFIFSRYFTIPLSKLRDATEQIKSEKYSEKVDIISSDDFGVLADNFNDMASSLDYKTKRIIAIQDSIIKGMAVMVESRDNSTGGHINRTSECVRILVRKLEDKKLYPDKDETFWDDIIKAAPMHDLGKIAIDDAILRKPGKYTDEEYEQMKIHAKEGARIVENVLREVDDEQFKTIAVNVAHFHHEKWDGSGYPNKLRGEEIPFEARIMALADVFDALVSKRCYKDKIPFEKAFEIIEESLGSHFDPVLGKIFLECKDELVELYNREEE